MYFFSYATHKRANRIRKTAQKKCKKETLYCIDGYLYTIGVIYLGVHILLLYMCTDFILYAKRTST